MFACLRALRTLLLLSTSISAEPLSTLSPLRPFSGDPNVLDSEKLYPSRSWLGTPPSFGADPAVAARGCSAVPRPSGLTVPVVPVVPIRIARPDASSPNAARYFSFRGKTLALVGVSADNGCHLEGLPANQCHKGNYERTLDDVRAAGLNKIRLWVSLVGEHRPANVPFVFDGSHWRLDQKNQAYFDSLRRVVASAQSRDLFVEVTFFAPFEGEHFEKGPWGGRGRLPNTKGQLEIVRFRDPRDFVVQDARGRTAREAEQHERLRAVQKNVIDWTVDELWCFDNLIWEIANEPEGSTVDPRAVAAWQRARIRDVQAAEARHQGANGPLDRGGHLIAVQPFTLEGASAFVDDPEVDLLNGHYTTVRRESVETIPDRRRSALDLGALTLVRRFGDRSKLFGWNETKITPLGGKAGTRAHRNGALVPGLPDPVRAEAWEFLFSLGAAYDHFGYLAGGRGRAASTPREVRRQLGVLARFMNALPLGRLRTNPAPRWVQLDPSPQGSSNERLDLSRLAHRFWAALETPLDATLATRERLFLLYVHHSTIRCVAHARDNAPEIDFTAEGCAHPLGFNAYDARLWPARPYSLRLSLGDLGPRAGLFDVDWISPATGQSITTEPLRWDPAAKTCNGGSCEITAPPFEFDITLRIQERALTTSSETLRRASPLRSSF